MRRLLAWILSLSAVAALLWLGLTHLEVDADVASVLPRHDPVVNDARYVLTEHPAVERVYVDVRLERTGADTDRAVGAGEEGGAEASTVEAGTNPEKETAAEARP